MVNLLEERLRSNSNAFEGLLSLIPAKYYYDDQTQEQWKAKKKSKSQTKEDKHKKLDPEQKGEGSMSTLEVMKEREKNAKPVVLPGQKLKMMQQMKPEAQAGEAVKEKQQSEEVSEEAEDTEDIDVIFDDEGNRVPLKREPLQSHVEESSEDTSKIEPSKDEQLKDSSDELPDGQKMEVKHQTNKPNLEALRSKLQAKIQDMKEKRRAPGTKIKGAPSSREAILAERKRKLDFKIQKKDFLQQQQQQQQDESGESDSEDEDSDAESQPRKRSKTEVDANNVMFQNIEFDDGNKITSNLQNLRKGPKKKGPAKNDIRAHLKLVEAKKAKLQDKDEMDQVSAKEKEKWQRAVLQAEGIKLRDDEKLLRKALKRKEAKKRRSTVEWKDRQQAVKNSKAEKQKRREENLQIRKENKGVKRSKQQKMKRAYNGRSNSIKRAGFEGRLKSGKKK
ncbi:RRP14 (YKL082C) [Zygosaccharomyces parabailii]|nr:RRP14 (YKL082C) [Zygosaccharomyces parabailii]